MVCLKGFIKDCNIKDITNNSILRDKWFVGSALMGINYDKLDVGAYYYEQDTIWTRILDKEIINTYWQIHNFSKNFLIINDKDYDFSLLNKLLNYYSQYLKIPLYLFHIITNDRDIFKRLNIKYCNNICDINLPFYINKREVGKYIKIFIQKNNRFYPFIDCTYFINEKSKYFFDININNSYETVVENNLKTIFEDSIYDNIFNILPYNRELDDLSKNTQKIKLASLLEAICFIGKFNVDIDSSYIGHSLKKLLKKSAVIILEINMDLDDLKYIMNTSYYEFIKDEIKFITNINTNKLLKFDKFTLNDRFGINNSIYNYLFNIKKEEKLVSSIENIKYFTDIPIIDEISNLDKFKFALKKIINNKERI